MIHRFQTSLANSDLCGKKGTKEAAAIRDQAMDLGRLNFDSSASDSRFDQRMLLLGGDGGSQIFGGARLALAGEEGASKRRAFFTSPDELLEEELYYCDEQLPEKKRRLTPEQVHLLERSFEGENKLEPERKSELAQKLGMQPRQVAVWFQNRRARWKTKQLEQDFDCLRSSYNSLLADHDSLLHENDQLRSQVVSLTEKLHKKAAATAAAAGIARIKVDDQAASVAHLMPPNVQMKVEDRLSTGSGGSAVLDGGDGANQLVDSSEESFFPEGSYCMNPVDGRIPSEEADDVSDEGCNYYSDGIFAAEHHQEEEDAQMGWWVWN